MKSSDIARTFGGPAVLRFVQAGILTLFAASPAFSQPLVRPVVTQFGWQFEKQFFSKADGPSAITEWVLLLGGLEQGVAIPSLSWMVGMRTAGGAEFGVGPNITPSGVALAIASGMTLRAGTVNVPINLAVVPSKAGIRVSILSGFSLRR